MMRSGYALSLPHLTMLDATPPQVVEAAAAAGFDACSLRLWPTMAGERQHPMLDNSPMLRETRARMADSGVAVHDLEALWLQPDSRPEPYLRAFEAAAALGGRWFQVIAADPDERRLTRTLRDFCEAAAGFGLGMALEYMAISQLKSLAAAQRVLEACAVDNLVLTLDALHHFRCATSIEALAGLDPDKIGLIQLCDAPLAAPAGHEAMVFEARFDRRLPGEGELPLAAWLRALPGDKVLAIEAPLPRAEAATPTERAQLLMRSLRRFLNQMDD